MTIERVAVVNASTFLVETVIDVDTTVDPPGTWPSNWITSTGKVNLAEVFYTYVPALNGFLPPQPNPTFLLDTTDLTWFPDTEEYYYWTSPVEMYYRYNRDEDNWTPYEFIGSDPSTPFPLPVYPTLGLSTSAPSVNPGDFIDIVLTSSGSNQPLNPTYTVTVDGDPVQFDYTLHTYAVTVAVSSEDGTTPVFYIGGIELPVITLFRDATYEFNQDDASNVGHALLLSETFQGTHAVPTPGTVYGVNVDYYLDGVQVADSAAYLSGFDAATQRKLVVNPLDPLQPVDLFYFDNATPVAGAIPNSARLQVIGDAPLTGSFYNVSGGGTVRLGISASSPPLTTSTVTVTVSSYTQNPITTSFDVVPI